VDVVDGNYNSYIETTTIRKCNGLCFASSTSSWPDF